MATHNPTLPVKGKRNVLITSALPYVNNIPHLGNVIGSVLSADVYSRWCKARGFQTLFVCGSDEYGTATETKALEEKVTPEELCTKYHAIHKDIYDWFDIEFDIFGRTPTEHQTRITQEIFRKLYENGFILEREEVQPFCPHPDHQSFLADRFIEGECSLCQAKDARGDQCDACMKLMDPFQPASEADATDGGASKGTGWLINPLCKVDRTAPEKRKTKHMYLRLDELSDDLKKWFADASKKGVWSSNSIDITSTWLKQGLNPRAITRDLKWGTPINKDVEGLDNEIYKNKVFYVWFDACIGYVSITANYTDKDNIDGKNWEKWWKSPDDVELVQFMGKDNVQFHSIMFPGSQIGTKEPWTKVHKLSTTEWLQYEGTKFSKSKKVGVFGDSAKDTGIGPDIWRYYLLSRRPETADSEFQWSEFVSANNNDLLKNLGNFNQRVQKFCQAKFDSTVPDYTKYESDGLTAHIKEINSLLAEYNGFMEATRLKDGQRLILAISSVGNKLLQDNKLDNRLLTEEPDRCAAVIGLALNQLQLLASISAPYMPTTAKEIFAQLGLEPSPSIPEVWDHKLIKPGHKLGTPKPLFNQIPDAKIEEWREKFGGEEARLAREAKAKEQEEKRLKKVADKEKKKAKKAAASAASKENVGVEGAEKREVADPKVEQVTEAIGKTDIHAS